MVDAFIVGKANVLGEDDSPDIDVVGEGVPFVKTKQNKTTSDTNSKTELHTLSPESRDISTGTDALFRNRTLQKRLVNKQCAVRYTASAFVYDAFPADSKNNEKHSQKEQKLSPNFAVVFCVGKEETLGEDDSANIDGEKRVKIRIKC